MKVIEVAGVSKSFRSLKVLDNISLFVEENRFVSILGPSGCGKSTLFNIISGLQLPDNGHILINGKDFKGKTGRISYMHQKDLLLPWKTILDNVCVPLILKKTPLSDARKKAVGYFKSFGLEGFEDAYPSQLSGGMRQRAALLRTFLFTSDIMMLDEPFGALDAITRSKMHLWLMNIYNQYQPSVLFITHDIDESILLSDKIYIFTKRPAKIKKIINVNIPRPRSQEVLTSPQFQTLKAEVINLLHAETGENGNS